MPASVGRRGSGLVREFESPRPGTNPAVTDTPPIECTNWYASHDRMPGREPTLHVTGDCTCPTPGYTVELTVAEPQGINPRDLLLRLELTPPTDVVPDVQTPCPVRFDWPTTATYDTVSIIDVAAGIPVEETS